MQCEPQLEVGGRVKFYLADGCVAPYVDGLEDSLKPWIVLTVVQGKRGLYLMRDLSNPHGFPWGITWEEAIQWYGDRYEFLEKEGEPDEKLVLR